MANEPSRALAGKRVRAGNGFAATDLAFKPQDDRRRSRALAGNAGAAARILS